MSSPVASAVSPEPLVSARCSKLTAGCASGRMTKSAAPAAPSVRLRSVIEPPGVNTLVNWHAVPFPETSVTVSGVSCRLPSHVTRASDQLPAGAGAGGRSATPYVPGVSVS